MRCMASKIHFAQYTEINCITSQGRTVPFDLTLVICFRVGEVGMGVCKDAHVCSRGWRNKRDVGNLPAYSH